MPPPTSGLIVWQDALAISQSDGTAVSQWDDASGNANHATQANAPEQPIYRTNAASTGFPAVQFDGTNDSLKHGSGVLPATNNIGSMLLCAVVRPTSVGVIRQVLAHNNGTVAGNSRISMGMRGTNQWSIGARRSDGDALAQINGPTAQADIGIFLTIEVDWANDDGRIWVGRNLVAENTAFLTAGNTSATDSLGSAIGARGDATTEYYAGYIFDAYQYVPTLSAANRDALWTWIEGRWGFLRYTDDMGARFRLRPPGLYAPMRMPLAPWMGTGVAPVSTGPQTINVAQAVETEVAQTVTPLRTYTTAQAVETEVAQAITVRKTVTVGQAVETELGQAVGKAKVKAADQALETELGQTPTVRKTVAVAQATETELGQTITPKGVIGQALETEVAQAVGKAKTRAVGQAAETEVAQAITVRKTVAVAQAVETEVSQAVTRVKSRTLGQPVETEIGQAVGKLKQAAVAQAIETELAQTVTSTGHKIIPVGQATETETSQTFTRVKARALAQAAETEAAQALTKRLAYALGQAVEDETGQAILTGLHVSNPPGRIVVGIPGGTVTVLGGGALVTGSAGGTIILLRSGALFDTFNDLYSDMYTASVGPPGVVHIERPAGILTIGE